MTGIDVIVPCYGYARYLRDSVGSVLATRGCEMRVLIIDDASPDETPAVAADLQRADGRVHYIRHARNIGHIATFNEGLRWARAECTLLLSADDLVTPGALARAARLMMERPELGMVFGHCLEWREGDPRPAMPSASALASHRVHGTREFVRMHRDHYPVQTSTAVVRTRLQHQLGGYRADLPHAGDMEMWLRFALHAPVGFIDCAQGVWRKHERNMSDHYYADMMRDLRQRETMLEAVFSHPAATPVADLRAELALGIAKSAVRAASQPFGLGDVAGARQMMAFAARLSPQVRRTRLWKVQSAKLALGSRAWRLLRPMATGMLGLSLDRFVAQDGRPRD